MLSPARNLCSRFRTHVAGEEGISAIEWIGLTAVVLVFLSAIFVYMQVHGGQVGAAAGSSMDGQIGLWESGGERAGPYSEDGPSAGGGRISPDSGGEPAPGGGPDSSAGSIPSRVSRFLGDLWGRFRGALGGLLGRQDQATTAESSGSEESGFGRLLYGLRFTQYPEVPVTRGDFLLAGTGKPGDVLQIYRNGESIGKVTVKDDGTWGITVAASRLSSGENTLTVQSSNSISDPITVTYSPPLRLDVPYRSQGLAWNRYCSIASMGMVLDYYHNLDPSHPTYSQDDIIKEVQKIEAEFAPNKGLNPDAAVRAAKKLGYQGSYVFNADSGWTVERLQQETAAGRPVVVTVYQAGEYHSIVVTGTSSDGAQVFVNDPLRGTVKEYSRQDFEGLWGARAPGDPEVYSNTGYMVLP